MTRVVRRLDPGGVERGLDPRPQLPRDPPLLVRLGLDDEPDHHLLGRRAARPRARSGSARITTAELRVVATWRRRPPGSRRWPRRCRRRTATGMSSSARDHCCDLLPTRWMLAVRDVPDDALDVAQARRAQAHALDGAGDRHARRPASMTSPTPNWSSTSMKMPERKSRTRRLGAEAERDAERCRRRRSAARG